MFTQIKLKLSSKKISFWSYLVIIPIFAIIFYLSYKFLMENVYYILISENIGDTEEQETAVKQDRININLFNDVIKKINEKTSNARTYEIINNPFD